MTNDELRKILYRSVEMADAYRCAIANCYDTSGDHLYIKRVIFNPPATIVFWNNGMKTVVKAQNGEPFDREKGLALAIIKGASGNRSSYYKDIRRWCEEGENQC